MVVLLFSISEFVTEVILVNSLYPA